MLRRLRVVSVAQREESRGGGGGPRFDLALGGLPRLKHLQPVDEILPSAAFDSRYSRHHALTHNTLINTHPFTFKLSQLTTMHYEKNPSLFGLFLGSIYKFVSEATRDSLNFSEGSPPGSSGEQPDILVHAAQGRHVDGLTTHGTGAINTDGVFTVATCSARQSQLLLTSIYF